MMRKVTLSILVIWAGTSSAWAIDGDSLALQSTGFGIGGPLLMGDNGFAGTYITLAAPASVTVTANAEGVPFDFTDPFMNLAIGDMKMGWSVGLTAANYQHTFDLPAGTHLVRAEYANDNGTTRSLQLNTLDISGATINNSTDPGVLDTNALNAANTYIENGRKGNATLYMPAIQPGTPVQVKLKTHEYNFGIAIPNSFTDTFLAPPEAPYADDDAAEFQQAMADSRFNSITPENAGKWSSNEGTRDVLTANAVNPNGGPNIPLMDRYMDYAEENNMRFRQHNLIWGRNSGGGVNQQPGWADSMLQNPAGIDGATGDTNFDALLDEISERIDYYVTDRAHRYYEVDVYNESYHTGSNQGHSSSTYWEVYGVNGIAGIYKEVKDAIAGAGADALAYVNEFNVVQEQGGDYYANWYMRHIEDLQNAGQNLYGENVVDGIGFQYYNNGTGGNHNAARIYAVLNNLAVQGLPMHLTEWGATGGSQANAADVLDDTARLVFGMPGTTGMTLWRLWAGAGGFAPVGVLYNNDWTLTPAGGVWQDLMDDWDTDLMINVAGDGTIDFSGFYGDYEITVGSQTFDLSFDKGGETDFLFYNFTTLGDTDGDGDVDIDDLVNVKNNMGSTSAGFAQGDTDGDGDVDATDLSNVKDFFGDVVTVGPPPGLTFVPEPTSLGLIGVGGLMLVRRRRS